MGQNVSGATQRTIESLQRQIQELRKDGVEKNRDKIIELNRQISEALAGDKTTGGKVDGGRVEITTIGTADGDVEVRDTDSRIATPEDIAKQQQYVGESGKAKVKEEFGTPTMTEAEFRALGNKIDKLRDEKKELEKAHKKAPAAERKELLRKLVDKRKELQEAERLYEREKVLQRTADGKGVGGIQKAAKNNVKQWTKTYKLDKVFLPTEKQQYEEYLAAHQNDPDIKDKVKLLNQNDLNALIDLQSLAEMIVEDAQAGVPDRYTQAQADQIKEQFSHALNMFNKDADGKVDYTSINVREVQDTLVDYSGFDQKFNFDESKQLAAEINSKKGNINHMVKNFGFGVENGIGKKFAAAGIAAGSALLGNFVDRLINGRASASQRSDAQVDVPKEEFTILDGVNKEKLSYINEEGQRIIEQKVEVLSHTGSYGGFSVYAHAAADVAVDMLKGAGLAGMFLGPAAAGLAAFLLANPKTENAFNGMTVDAALYDTKLKNVSGDDNKAIMAQIQALEITGNQAIDLRIKSAVIQAAIGKMTTNANTEELLAAYEAIKATKDAILQIEVSGQPTTPTVETQPTISTVVTEPTDPTGVTGPTGPTCPTEVTEPTDPCYNIEEKEIYTQVPIIRYGGPWHYTQLYVYEDGTELSAADRKALTKLLQSGEDGIRDHYNDAGKRDGRNLKTEITLPSGKVVKLATDAAERAKKIQGKPGGRDVKYSTETRGSRMRAVDCKTGQPLTGWMTPEEFDKWEDSIHK